MDLHVNLNDKQLNQYHNINMNIIYDYQIFSAQRYGGISRYFVELIHHIVDSGKAKVSVISPIYVNAYLATTPRLVRVVGLKMPVVRFTGRFYRAINQLLSGVLLRWSKPDLVHETYFSGKSTMGAPYKRVLTVYDMIHELLPEEFAENDTTAKAKAKAVGYADHVICISERTRSDLIDILKVPREKTSVVYLGFSLRTSGSKTYIPVRRAFLLYVGARGGYKNFACLLRTYAANTRLKNEFDLLAFGGGEITDDENKLIRQLGIPKENLQLIHGGDDVLEGLYRRAAVFIYPSLYEGFGIPPLEAMSFNCPVVCSNTSSIPEIVGDAAVLFDPKSSEELDKSLISVLYDEGLRKTLIARGQERVKQFSWEKCARQTMAIYHKVLSCHH